MIFFEVNFRELYYTSVIGIFKSVGSVMEMILV